MYRTVHDVFILNAKAFRISKVVIFMTGSKLRERFIMGSTDVVRGTDESTSADLNRSFDAIAEPQHVPAEPAHGPCRSGCGLQHDGQNDNARHHETESALATLVDGFVRACRRRLADASSMRLLTFRHAPSRVSCRLWKLTNLAQLALRQIRRLGVAIRDRI